MTKKNRDMKISKPDFSHIGYDPHHICWGHGNNAVGPRLLARIKIDDKTTKAIDKKERLDYEAAKLIYDTYIKKGTCFTSGGKMGHRGVYVKITYIDFEKESICWKQYNIKDFDQGMKPAKGKFSINAFIALYRSKEIILI